jgi:hypothetical protein
MYIKFKRIIIETGEDFKETQQEINNLIKSKKVKSMYGIYKELTPNSIEEKLTERKIKRLKGEKQWIKKQ